MGGESEGDERAPVPDRGLLMRQQGLEFGVRLKVCHRRGAWTPEGGLPSMLATVTAVFLIQYL